MSLDSHLTTYILKAFVKSPGIGDNHVDVIFFAVVVSVVSDVVVLGLIKTISVVDVGLEFA